MSEKGLDDMIKFVQSLPKAIYNENLKTSERFKNELLTESYKHMPKETGTLMFSEKAVLKPIPSLGAVEIVLSNSQDYARYQHDEVLRHPPNSTNMQRGKHKMEQAAKGLGYAPREKAGRSPQQRYSSAYSWMHRHGLLDSALTTFATEYRTKAIEIMQPKLEGMIRDGIFKIFKGKAS
jgi:hypothetical protein